MVPFDPLWAQGIGTIESSNNYGALGPRTRNGDRAYGRYQVMGNNIPTWTQQALGYSMTPQQFLQDQKAQDQVFQHIFGGYAQKYGNPQDAASMWFSGRPLAKAGNADDGYINVPTYVSRFNKAMGQDMPMNENAQPALSQGAMLGPGVLGNASSPFGASGQSFGNRLIGAGAALASISSPQQGAAMSSLLRQQMHQNGFSVHVDPKTGNGVRLNTKTGEVTPFKAFNAIPETDKNWDNARTKANSDLYDKIDTDAEAANGNLANVGMLRSALSDPNVYQGTGGEMVQTLRKAANSMGFQVEGTTNGDVAKSLMSQLTLSMRNFAGGMPGSLSDKDLAFLRNMTASLGNTPEANQRILNLYEKLNQRRLDVQRQRDAYAASHGGRLDDGFRRQLTQWSQQNPLFSENDLGVSAAPAAGARPPLNTIFK